MKSNPFQIIFGGLFSKGEKVRDNTGVPPASGVNREALENRAIVDEAIVPHFGGRVRFHNSWWPALCQQNITLLPGEILYVVGRYNIVLLVEPASSLKTVVESSGEKEPGFYY